MVDMWVRARGVCLYICDGEGTVDTFPLSGILPI